MIFSDLEDGWTALIYDNGTVAIHNLKKGCTFVFQPKAFRRLLALCEFGMEVNMIAELMS